MKLKIKTSSTVTKSKTSFGVYIIESSDLSFKDGEKLNDILDLMKFPCYYRAVETKNEFQDAIAEFNALGLRYLHLSCHADVDGIQINGTDIDNYDLIAICKRKIENKRIFLSACQTSAVPTNIS
jgi:hypothetical protein